MTWKNPYGFPFAISGDETTQSFKSLNTNEQCFIRKDHRCGKYFSASKSCFIACPNDDELEPILALIAEKLAKVGIEAVIAVKERAYGQDIFCTKICGKIIESKFCIVILDDTVKDSKSFPNPNVYYEYGLMTSLKKHIIPFQKDGLELAFNIQSYDTVKYSPKNIADELDRAIKDGIKITESENQIEKKGVFSESSILRNLELADFQLKDENWFLHNQISDTRFKGFGQYDKHFYLFLGKLDNENDKQAYIEDLNIILYRIEKKVRELEEKLKNERKTIVVERPDGQKISVQGGNPSVIKDLEEKIGLVAKIFIGFIITPDIDASDFIKKAESLIKKYKRFMLTHNISNEIAFGDLKVSLIFDIA